jgi:replicative DNA helicase
LDYSTIKNDYKNVGGVEVNSAMVSTGEGGTVDQTSENIRENLDEPTDAASPFVAAKSLLLTIYNELDELAENGEFVYGVATGLSDLDAITGGLQKGNFVLVAGGAGMGKSTLCQNIARRVSKRKDVAVAYFSLEATSKQIVQRLLAADAEVDSLRLLTGRMNENEWGEVAGCVQGLHAANLFLDDRLHKSVTDIWAACDELPKVGELGLVIIDSLPLVSDGAPTDVWNAAKLLKLMARHFNVPVVAATHLYSSRTDRRADRRPMMGDLAGVESYADEVILLHRPTFANTESIDGDIEILDVIVTKQANGPTGLIRLGFAPRFALITDLNAERQDEPTGF